MLRLSLVLVPSLLLAACRTEPPPDDTDLTEVTPSLDTRSTPTALSISNPFTVAAPAGGTGGVFLTLTGGPEVDTLLGASFAGAEQVEVHETYDTDGGLRGMREAESGLPVPAAGIVELVPGGYHIMLINLADASAEGDTLDLTLNFAQAGPQEVRVPVLGLDQIRRPDAD